MSVSTKDQSIDHTLENKSTKHYKGYIWINIIAIGLIHLLAIYGLWLLITFQINWKTILFNVLYTAFVITSVTAGAHRLWSHKAYKAKMPFRIWLALGHAAAFQRNLHTWVRDHRVHHMFTDTDADPHNSRRGFFFSHIGWLFVARHNDVQKKGKAADMADVLSDPVVQFQIKYYVWLLLLFAFILPTYVPMYFWGEIFTSSFFASITRIAANFHITFLVNSVAHRFGYKPYDVNIRPTENKIVSILTFGEGWHNYHHVFPWDYRAGEFGNTMCDLSTHLIDFMAYIGQAYDLRSPSKEIVKNRIIRTGNTAMWKHNNNNGSKNYTVNNDSVEQKAVEDNISNELKIDK